MRVASDDETGCNKEITREEENVLRYVAGYICRKICDKLQATSLPHKDDLILCIHDMCGHDESEGEGTKDWINAVDRGGLWHVNDQTYSIFYALEDLVRKHFTRFAVRRLTDGSKQSLITTLESDEDILFQWCMLTASTDDNNASVLLHRIIELYVTTRGFSFASSCVELYKKSSKRPLQKGKGIRKELFTSNV